ncbi:hypothetical protein J6590_067652 [Homalodisca vitripennis]|nr:hypothetical protein J6590_067652 [Homalodisca vitripennis]
MVPQQGDISRSDSPTSSGLPLFGSQLVDKNSSTPYSDATQLVFHRKGEFKWRYVKAWEPTPGNEAVRDNYGFMKLDSWLPFERGFPSQEGKLPLCTSLALSLLASLSAVKFLPLYFQDSTFRKLLVVTVSGIVADASNGVLLSAWYVNYEKRWCKSRKCKLGSVTVIVCSAPRRLVNVMPNRHLWLILADKVSTIRDVMVTLSREIWACITATPLISGRLHGNSGAWLLSGNSLSLGLCLAYGALHGVISRNPVCWVFFPNQCLVVTKIMQVNHRQAKLSSPGTDTQSVRLSLPGVEMYQLSTHLVTWPMNALPLEFADDSHSSYLAPVLRYKFLLLSLYTFLNCLLWCDLHKDPSVGLGRITGFSRLVTHATLEQACHYTLDISAGHCMTKSFYQPEPCEFCCRTGWIHQKFSKFPCVGPRSDLTLSSVSDMAVIDSGRCLGNCRLSLPSSRPISNATADDSWRGTKIIRRRKLDEI